MTKTSLYIAKKEITELLRQPLFLILAFLVPVVMFIVFGYGITLDIKNMPFGVLDLDNSRLSRDIINRFAGEYFDFKGYVRNLKDAEKMMSNGKLRALLVIPPDFSKEFYKDSKAELQLLIDGGYPYTASTLRGYAQSIIAAYNTELIEYKKNQNIPFIKIQTRFFFNESIKTSNALVPGLLVVIMMVNPAVLVATAIAREKEFGTIYNFYSSAVPKIEYLSGKLLPYIVVSLLNFFVLVGLIKILFGISSKGSLLVLLPYSLVFILINILIGVFISVLTKTIVAAQIITLIITTIPAFLYSGLLIPVSHLGIEGQIMARIYPAMYFMRAVQGVYLKKLSFINLIPEFMWLILYLIVFLMLTLQFFKKKEA